MRIDDFAEKLQTRDIPWDAAAAQRTLARVEGRLRNREPKLSRPLVLAFAGCVAVLCVGLVAGFWPSHAVTPSEAQGSRAAITLPDSSIAFLAEDAHIDMPEHSASALTIAQDRGRVEYHVTPGLPRRFTVRARNLEIRVVGTRFTVNLEPTTTLVSVEHGRVLVNDGVKTIALTANQSRGYPVTPVQAAPGSPPEAQATVSAVGTAEPVQAPSAAAAPPPAGPSVVEPHHEPLLEEADRARQAGKISQAIAALQKFIQTAPNNPQVASAAFTLGRLQRQSGNLEGAARSFQLTYQKDASGALAEDARAQEIEALSAAAAWDAARAAARKYLALYPRGRYRSRISPLVE